MQKKHSSKDLQGRRDPRLFVGRMAALSFSIGVVGVLMFRAGLGCGSTTATADSSTASSSFGAGTVSAAASASASASTKQKYLGGSKAWGGDPIDDALVFGADSSALKGASASNSGPGVSPVQPRKK